MAKRYNSKFTINHACRKYDPDKLAEKALIYAENTEIPILAEFANQNGITSVHLHEMADNAKHQGHPALSEALRTIIDAKQISIEKNALKNKFNSAMSIFSLKQMGWSDAKPTEANTELIKTLVEVLKNGK